MANILKAKSRRKTDKFVKVLVWSKTKERLVNQLNARNRGQKEKQSLAGYVDDLSLS